jgi:hypothetical protein
MRKDELTKQQNGMRLLSEIGTLYIRNWKRLNPLYNKRMQR